MYKVARDLVEDRWDDPTEAADGLGVLLLTWNQAAYRYGIFDFDVLERFLRRHRTKLDDYRGLKLEDQDRLDKLQVDATFEALLDALITSAKTRSPVAAGKALHMIAPRFFPLWDNRIAEAYGCRICGAPGSAQKYLNFMGKTQEILHALREEQALQEIENELNAGARFKKPILKFLDEYNYARFTWGWIS